MTVAVSVVVEFPSTIEDYDAVNARLDTRANPPEGLVIHCGADVGGGNIRVIDIWDSAETYGRWAQERLGPAIAEVIGFGAPAVEPQITELHDVIEG